MSRVKGHLRVRARDAARAASRRVWRRRRVLVLTGVLLSALVFGPPVAVRAATADGRFDNGGDVPPAPVALVLGAGLTPSGELSPFLAERVATAVDLYRDGRVQALLMSGDHSRVDHDEVAAMAAAAEAAGVPASAIVADHAGFDTYSSCYRARSVWGLDRVIVVSQAFHLPRAVWLCRRLGVDADGVAASDAGHSSTAFYGVLREVLAVDKAVLDVARRRSPRFPGPPEPAFDRLDG